MRRKRPDLWTAFPRSAASLRFWRPPKQAPPVPLSILACICYRGQPSASARQRFQLCKPLHLLSWSHINLSDTRRTGESYPIPIITRRQPCRPSGSTNTVSADQAGQLRCVHQISANNLRHRPCASTASRHAEKGANFEGPLLEQKLGNLLAVLFRFGGHNGEPLQRPAMHPVD